MSEVSIEPCKRKFIKSRSKLMGRDPKVDKVQEATELRDSITK